MVQGAFQRVIYFGGGGSDWHLFKVKNVLCYWDFVCTVHNTFQPECSILYKSALCNLQIEMRLKFHMKLRFGLLILILQWCIDGKCVQRVALQGAVDGQWSDWQAIFKPCSRTCGGGVRLRKIRYCNNPR